jgi:hypothetical protein
MKIVVFSDNAGMGSFYQSGMMNAAAPEGTPPRRIGDERFKKILCLPCLREAMGQVSIVMQFLWFWFERYGSCPCLQSKKNVLFFVPSGFDAHVTGPVKILEDYCVNTEDFRYISSLQYRPFFPYRSRVGVHHLTR